METLFPLIGLAIVLFVSTNIDDVFVLLAFFADPKVRGRDIVIGQYLGIGALFMASVIASLLSLLFAEPYIGLLGILPILIGLMQLYGLLRPPEDDEDAQPTLASRSGHILAVAGITIANGGDNIGIYTPVFSTRVGFDLAVIGVVFAVMTALWCLAARWLVSHPLLGAPIRRYGKPLVPFVLIALGLLVLWEAGSFALFFG